LEGNVQDRYGPSGPSDRGFGGRRYGFGFGGPFFRENRMPSPEEREQFYDRAVQGYMERGARYYDLTEEQKAQVKARLEQLKAEQRRYVDAHVEQLDALRRQLRSDEGSVRGPGAFNDPNRLELFRQMRSFFENSPLLNPMTVTNEIEQLLPPEQAERGRARWQEDLANWQRGGSRGRVPGDSDQQDGRDRQGPPIGEQRDGRDRGRGGFGRDGFRRDGRDDADRGRERRQRGDGGPDRGGDQTSLDPDAALGPWERYVRDFVRRYQLDVSQQATAASVLRSLQEQRTLYEATKQADFQAARQIQDESIRQKQLDYLNDPVKHLFEELKSQLERIPTAAQRMNAATRPAASTQPSATRPAFEDRRGPEGERRGRFGERGGGPDQDRRGGFGGRGGFGERGGRFNRDGGNDAGRNEGGSRGRR
jgi:hypothetical protein